VTKTGGYKNIISAIKSITNFSPEEIVKEWQEVVLKYDR
jgi:hypothetical protein